jgi:glycosyltransferase involved in cell wall biosynthesis
LTDLSIVIPVYNEELNLVNFFERLENQLKIIDSKNLSYELIINDNSSNDKSWELICQASTGYKIIAHRFARNYGFQASLMFGLKKSNGKIVIVLQSDLQDPPEIIVNLLDEHKKTNFPVILAVPKKRTDRFFLRTMRGIFYKILQILSDYTIIKNTQDFYLLTRPVVNEIIQSPVFNQFIRTRIIENYGTNLSIISYEKEIRRKGMSSFNFTRLYSLAMDAFLMQSAKFLRFLTIISGLIFILGGIIIIVAFTAFILGYKFPVSGYTSLLFLLIFNLVVATLGFSLTLEYLMRQHKFNFHPDHISIIGELRN